MLDRSRKTDERVFPGTSDSVDEYLLILRHVFAYEFAVSRIPAGQMVIDVGCGTGYGVAMLGVDARVVLGLDVSKEAVDIAAEEYGRANCTFATYNGVDIPASDRSVDAVVSFQVLEHVVDDSRFIAEISRVLREDGCLLLTTPNKRTRLRHGDRPWNRFHVREYTADELKQLLAKHFTTVAILGVSATEEILDVERRRVRSAQLRARLDPLDLRRLIPPSWVPGMMKVYRTLQLRKAGVSLESATGRFTVEDFRADETLAETGMDLLAVCSGPKLPSGGDAS